MLMPIITMTKAKIMDTVMMLTQDKAAMVEVVVTKTPNLLAGIDRKTPRPVKTGTCLPKKPESQATEPTQTPKSPLHTKEDGKNTKEKACLAKVLPKNTTSRAEVLAESLLNKTMPLKR